MIVLIASNGHIPSELSAWATSRWVQKGAMKPQSQALNIIEHTNGNNPAVSLCSQTYWWQNKNFDVIAWDERTQSSKQKKTTTRGPRRNAVTQAHLEEAFEMRRQTYLVTTVYNKHKTYVAWHSHDSTILSEEDERVCSCLHVKTSP